jgi:hypothetical protein
MNVAVIVKTPKVSGSISKPNVLDGTAKVIVSVVTELYVPSTLGVADSVSGGLPQVDQPPPGTVCTVNAVESVMVWVPSERELVVVLFAAVIGITVVELVYVPPGVEIGVKVCAKPEIAPIIPMQALNLSRIARNATSRI